MFSYPPPFVKERIGAQALVSENKKSKPISYIKT